jgi:outer membrane protein insertion porin family
MAFVRQFASRSVRSGIAGLIACAASVAALVFLAVTARAQQAGDVPAAGEQVVDVRVVGNEAVPLHMIVPNIRTRAGRPFDLQQVEDDVRRLTKSRKFVNVTTRYQRSPEGIIVIFEVVERPTLRYVRYPGATLRRTTLDKQSGLKVGEPVDPYVVDEARRKLEEYYQSKGFARVRVSTVEGNKPGDRGAVFLVNEGPKQKIWDIEFEGNTIAEDGRLKTQIQSKTPMLYLFGGTLDRKQLDQDCIALDEYYKSLGFYSAKIGAEVEMDDDNDWATVRFVIHEGPRYRVRSVSVIGAKQFPTAELEGKMNLRTGEFFDQATMNRDVGALQDRYGGIGFVYCNIQPDIRLHEQPGEMDLVYQIEEGDRFRVGRVDVRIEGDDPHTRINTVLNRIDLRPGDIVDTRKIRESERRLQASGLFKTDRAQGIVPRITWQAPETGGVETIASQPGGSGRAGSGGPPGDTIRGQSPDQRWERTGDGNVEQFTDAKPLVVSVYEDRLFAPQAPPEPPSNVGPTRISVDRGTHVEPYAPAPSPITLIPSPTAADPPVAAPPAADSTFDPFAPIGHGNPFASQRRYAEYQEAVPTQSGYAEDANTVAPGTSTAPDQSTWQPAVFNEHLFDAPPSYGGLTIRAQSPSAPANYGAPSAAGYGQVPMGSVQPGSTIQNSGYGSATSGAVTPVQYNAPYPGVQPGLTPVAPNPYVAPAPGGAPLPPGYGSGGDLLGQPVAPYDPNDPFTRDLTLQPTVQEAQTGRFMLGVGINSNAGLLGSIVLDEQNADLLRWPGSWRDLIEGRAFRGAGQQFRLEAMPGTQVSRYTAIWRQPYLFDTRVQFGVSGYYFQRYYRDWLEERLGGRLQLGYTLPYVPDLSFSAALRMEQVGISQPTVPTPPQLARVLGDSALYVGEFAMVHDTRDSTFLATQGHRVMLGFDIGFGDFTFPRATLEGRQHFLLGERPDGSGRRTLTLMSQLGFSGSETPIYENYFAGGFSSMRGFNFRGVGPYVGPVNVGGTYQWLNTVEYMFSITADDMIRGVVFCDFGTVEEKIEMHADNFRVAPGFGLRITVPAMGPAPIALDFAVPVTHAPGDDLQNFSFYVGTSR